METGNKKEMALILKQYKLPTGEVNYPMVMSVPLSERLPALFQKDFLKATALVGMAIATAFDRMRFKKKPDGKFINDLAEEIIDTADEDNLALEDLVLFLQGMVRGKYGNVEDISISRFMNLFEQYRQERHEAILSYRDNEHIQYKGLGDATRSYKTDALSEHFANFANSMSTIRENMKELRTQHKENEVVKKAEKFFSDKK